MGLRCLSQRWWARSLHSWHLPLPWGRWAGDDPSVDLGALIERHFCFAVNKAVDVGIEGKTNRYCTGCRRFFFYFFYPGQVKFEVVPGGALAIMYQRVASAPWVRMVSNGSTTLPRRFDIFTPFYRARGHWTTFCRLHCQRPWWRWRGGCKPTPRLVHSFCNEVGREWKAVVDLVFGFKRIVPLRVGHGAESNHTSMRSSSLFMGSPLDETSTTSSIYGRCRSLGAPLGWCRVLHWLWQPHFRVWLCCRCRFLP